MKSYNQIISNDKYNSHARELNERVLSKFPTNILKILTLVGNAEYYS